MHLDIVEKDFFGLQFTDPYNVQHWLDPTKLVKKQVKSEYIFNFFFLNEWPSISMNDLTSRTKCLTIFGPNTTFSEKIEVLQIFIGYQS